jgi:hypothetical protein
MAKVLANGSIKPLNNEYRNSDTMSEAQREARYSELASADNPYVEVGTPNVRGGVQGMVPIRNKPTR